MKLATALIDTAALTHNVNVIRQYAAHQDIWIMVKANAYGHGMLAVARALAPLVTGFGVARIDEALLLCQQKIVKPILLLEGYFSLAELEQIAKLQLHTVVHSIAQLELIEQYNAKQHKDLSAPISVWLKIDTGMHRLGFLPEQVSEVIERLTLCESVAKPLNFMSHFSSADEKDSDFTKAQISLFEKMTKGLAGKKSIAASSGCFNWPTSLYDAVRPGISVYGISPMEALNGQDLGLKPVMSMTSSLIAVRDVAKGGKVGYGASWQAKSDTRLGVVAMGYGDGYPRLAPTGTPMLVNGRKVPIVGRVSMDMITVDLGANATDKVGDEVILWGEGLPVEEVARHIGTLGYELVTQIMPRVKYIYS